MQAKNGAAREEQIVVRVLHEPTMAWSALAPTEGAPPARGSHTARTHPLASVRFTLLRLLLLSLVVKTICVIVLTCC